MADTRDDKGADAQRIDLGAFSGDILGVLERVRQGRSFLVTSSGETLAELRPPPRVEASPRRPGALRGQIHMADDFDTLPPDVIEAIEG